MTAPGGLFDDIYKSPTQQRRGGGLFDDIYTAGETEEEKRRKEEERRRQEAFRGAGTSGSFEGPSLLERAGRSAIAGTADIAANIAGLGRRIGTPGLATAETMLRGTAMQQRQRLGAPRGATEIAAQMAGEMAPSVAATMAGGGVLRGLAAGPGRIGTAARALLGPERVGGTALQQAGQILRQNIGGAVAAAPLVTVPGAIAGGRQSTTASLSQMLEQGEGEPGMARRTLARLAETTPGRVAGDIAFDVLAGTALETAGRGVVGVGRAAATRARQRLNIGAGAVEGAGRDLAQEMAGSEVDYAARLAEIRARRQAQEEATQRLMAEEPSPISQAMRQFETMRAGYGPRALELPARPEAPATPSVREAIDAMRQPFVGRARAERMLAENAAQVEAGREGYRQTVRGAREAQLGTQAEIAAREAQAAQDALNAPTIAQRTALERLRERAPGIGIGLAQAGVGAGAGYAAGETPEERAYLASIGAGLAGVPRLGARAGVPSIPQEVRSVGRFGFVRLPETYTPNLALETEHVANVMARTEPILSRIGARTQEAVNGAGLFGGDVSPNSIMRFAENAPDEELRTAAAVRGLAFGQDQQLWYRKARPAEPNTTAAFVLTGKDFAELPDEAIDAIVTRLRADDALGPYGGATRDGNHLLALNLKRYTGMDDEQFGRAVRRAVDEIGDAYDIDVYPSAYYAEHLDGSSDYVRAIGRRPDALRAARDAIVDAEPEYLRYAQATGADVEAARREIADRVESLDRLLRQIEQPPPLGETKGRITVAEAAKQVYKRFPRLRAQRDEVVVPEMVTRLSTLVDDLVTQGVIPREMAQDWYRGATLDQRQIARLALPELREDPKYTLYTVVNSILSSGQQVPVESRQGLNVFDQYLRTGRFSILNPADAQYRQALTGGKKGFTGERGTGLLGEAMAASPRTLNHEQALARLDALVQAFGEEGAVEALVEGVPIMAGRTVKEERPALVYLFGPKIGQYAMDKLGIPGGGKSTIDLWMARLDYALRGDAGAIQGNKLNDTVLPTMRRRMQGVLAEFAKQNNMPESSAQALAWYAIKNAFRKAGAKEQKLAYATLGSGTTEAMMTPIARELGPEPLAQGLMRPGAYEGAAEGWNDPRLREFARRTGRQGTIAPMQGAFAGKVFESTGALAEGLRTPAGRQIATQAGIGAAGYGLSQSDDERLRATGQQMMGLAALSLAYPAVKQAGKYGGVRVRDALAQTESGRKVLNTLSYDILADPRVKSMVEEATTEMARYRAIGQQLASEARALGPQGDRVVSDIVEREAFEQAMSPDDMAAAIAVANRVADAVQGMGQEKVGLGLLSPETFAKRERSYLPRRYGRYAGEEAAGAVQPEDFLTTAPQYGQGKTFRIKGEKQRLDLTPEQRLELGEIREASYRIADAFGRGGKDIASARLFKGLSDIPGVIEPRYKAATDEALEARRLRDAARESGDADAARNANQAYLAARQQAAQIAEEFTRGGEYVKLPDTNALGVLKNAVVRKDVADYLNNVPSFSDTRTTWAKLFQAWKRIHTVYNPGTHVGNFVSNAALVHMGGLPVPQQPVYLAKAAQGLKNYDADVKFLTEQGVLERGLPLYGDTPVKGKAQDEAALRALARTTRPETRAALEKQGLKPMGTAEMRARQVGAKVERAYALEDGVYRVALFKKFRADGMDSKAAADQVMKVLPGYDTRSPLLTSLRNTVSPFILYPAKYIPTALDLIMQHPERWVALAMLWGGLDQMSRRKYEPLEQRDLPPNQRSLGYLVPGRIQVDAIARPAFEALGVGVPAGDKYTFDVARWTPFSALTGSPAPGSIATQISEDIPGILQPGGPIQDIGALMVNRDPFTGEAIIQPGMTGGEKAMAIGGRAASLALPSVASFQIPRVARDVMRGDPAAAAIDLMGVVGLRPQVVKPGVQAMREERKYEEARRRILLETRIELMRNQRPERVDAINEKAFRKLEAAAAKYRKALGYEDE